MDGSVTVESSGVSGEGTAFVLRLPVDVSAPAGGE
jgi:hypothetical protein